MKLSHLLATPDSEATTAASNAPSPTARPIPHAPPHWSVLHHIPGRVRLRLPARLRNRQSARDWPVLLGRVAGVRSVRVNRTAGSIAIGYEPQIEAQLMARLADLSDLDELAPQQNGATNGSVANGSVANGSTTQGSAIAALGRHLSVIPSLPRIDGASSERSQTLHQLTTQPQSRTHSHLQLVETAPTPASTQIAKSAMSASAALDEIEGIELPLVTLGLAAASRLSRLPGLRSLAWVTLLAAAFPVAKRALRSLVGDRKFNIDCLDFLALTLSATQGKIVTPALVLALHEFGDAIRDRTARTTAVETASLEDAIGHFAWVKVADDAPPVQVPSDRVQVGQTVVVYPGEQIPVDGLVLGGEATIDQQSLTGEAMPIVGSRGTQVYASTLVRSGKLEIRAERIAGNTRAAAGLALLKDAPVHDTRMANYAEQVADKLILPSLLLAGFALIATRDPARAAAILTLDFVTGVRVSIPMAFLGALNHTTRHGVLIRSGRTLEQLADIDTIVFDKTGTLTQGRIAVVDVRPCDDTDLDAAEILRLAASAEQRINHPIAEAIVSHAEQQGLTLLDRDTWSYEVGLGLSAQLEGRRVLVGSERFLRQSGIEWTASAAAETGEKAVEKTGASTTAARIYIACDDRFQGSIAYTDPLRHESAELIHRLNKEYGITTHLLTGDNPERAAQVAAELNIPTDRVYAEAFPEQKAQVVHDLHKAGHTVAFVGDGLNDSIALAYADASVSFARGSEIARETADVVLMDDHLLDFLEVIAIARHTRSLIEQNIGLVVLPNLMALGVATTTGLSPLVASAIHNGSAIVAGLNSLRPLLEHKINPERMAS